MKHSYNPQPKKLSACFKTKNYLLLLVLLLCSSVVFTQSYTFPTNGTTSSITTCSGTLRDAAGTGNYTNNNNGYVTINPSIANNLVRVSGTTSGESCCDFVQAWDGAGTGGTFLGTWYMNTAIPTLTSTTGPLTLRFYSDYSVVGAGPTITISCICPTPTVGSISVPSTSCQNSITVTNTGSPTNYNSIRWYRYSYNTASYTDLGITNTVGYTDVTNPPPGDYYYLRRVWKNCNVECGTACYDAYSNTVTVLGYNPTSYTALPGSATTAGVSSYTSNGYITTGKLNCWYYGGDATSATNTVPDLEDMGYSAATTGAPVNLPIPGHAGSAYSGLNMVYTSNGTVTNGCGSYYFLDMSTLGTATPAFGCSGRKNAGAPIPFSAPTNCPNLPTYTSGVGTGTLQFDGTTYVGFTNGTATQTPIVNTRFKFIATGGGNWQVKGSGATAKYYLNIPANTTFTVKAVVETNGGSGWTTGLMQSNTEQGNCPYKTCNTLGTIANNTYVGFNYMFHSQHSLNNGYVQNSEWGRVYNAFNPSFVKVTVPAVGTVTHPTCATATGSVAISGLPSGGTLKWTGAASGSTTYSGTSTSVSGLVAGNYTFTVDDASGFSSCATGTVTINAQPVNTATPTVTSPICVGATSVSGTVTAANGTTITVYSGVTSLGTTTVTSNAWTKTGLAALTAGESITARAQTSGLCLSATSNAVVVATTATPTVTSPICVGATTVSGTSSAVNGTTITVFSGATNLGTTTVTAGAWSKTGLAALAAGASITATAQTTGQCASAASTAVVVATTATPVVTSPICVGATTVSGTSTAVNGTTITVYSGATNLGTTTVSAGTWSKTGLTALGAGASITATAQTTGQCVSAASTAVVVATTTAPVVTSPICVGATSVSGTLTASNGTVITVYSGATNLGTTTVTSNAWSKTGLAALAAGASITATAQTTGQCVSAASTAVVVATTPTPTVTSPICVGATSVSGTITAANGTTITVYSGATNLGTTTVTSNAWTKTGLTALASGASITATAQTTGQCVSAASTAVVVATTTAPVVTSPICVGATSVSGTLTASNGTVITVYSGATNLGTTTVTSNAWTKTGLTALAAGASITATAQTSGQCLSAASTAVVVATTATPTVTSPICVGATSVSGTVTAANGTVITVYSGATNLGTTTVTSNAWTKTGLAALASGASITATAQTTGSCVSAASSAVIVATTPTPTVTSPICVGATSVSGTVTAANGTTITVYSGATNLGTTTVTSNAWTKTGLAALASGASITATAQTSGSCVSAASSAVVVATTATPVVTSPICVGATSVSGTVTAANGTTITVYSGATNLGTTTVTSNAWTKTGLTALAAGASITAIAQTAGGCSSAASAAVVVSTTASTTVTSPICVGATSVSGTSGAPNGTTITVYSGATSLGTTTVSGGVWSKTGLTALTAGESITAIGQTAGSCVSATSNAVVVATTATPVVNSPICVNSTSVSGTSSAANGTTITVYSGVTNLGTTTVSVGTWTLSGLSPLASGASITATAQTSGQCVSAASVAVVVGTSGAPTVTSPICVGSTSVSGTITAANGTVITVYSGATSLGTTTVTSNAWTKTGLTALTAGESITATAQTSGQCVSASSVAVIVATTAIPAVNSPICVGATSVSGTSTAANGTTITVYSGVTNLGTTTVSGGTWTKTGLSALASGASITATAQTSGQCVSAASAAVVVATTATPTVTSPICVGATSVSGTVTAANGTVITVYSGATNLGTTTVTSNAWTKTGLAALASGASITATAQTTGSCVSTASTAVVVATTATPAVTSPICVGATSVSGTVTAANGTIITVYSGVTNLGTTTVTSNAWTKTGLAALASGASITATAQTTGSCVSAASAAVVVGTSTAPTVTSPICVGATSVSGTITAVNGTVITVYSGATNLGTTTVTSNAWTLSGLSALASGASITATAQAAGSCVSVPSAAVVVATSAAPVVISPICVGATSVSGTSAEVNGTTITVYSGVTNLGTTTVNSGNWTKTGLTALASGASITATAQAPGSCLSAASTAVVVATTATPVVNSPICVGATSVSGTLTAANGTIITVYSGATNLGTTTVTSNAWTKSGLTALVAGASITATAQTTGQCVSAASAAVVVATTATPVVNSPICAGATSVSGTSTAPNGTTITIYSGATSLGTTTVSSGAWAKTGLTALTVGESITAIAQTAGQCASAASTVVIVNPILTAGVTVSANVTVICPGINVTFTATPTNGGSSPLYQFQLNGGNVGSNSSTATYSNNALADNDYVTCVLTSNAACVLGSPATSNTETITVISPAAPTATVTAQPTCTVPSGTITVTAPVGVNYEYSWDGVNYYASTTLTGVTPGTHTLTSRLAASPSCVSPASGTLTVNAVPTPLPAITPVTICQGGTGNLVATGINCIDNFTIPTLPNRIYGGWLSSSPTATSPAGTVNTTSCSFTGPSGRSYQSVPFQVSVSGSYTFEMNNNTTYNGAGYITTGSFTPGSCASGTLVRMDNDGGSGDEPVLGPMTLTAGITYYLVSTTEGASNVINNDYTWTITPPGGGNVMLNQPGTVEWYTAASGGSAIGTGATFNPVGVAGSGLPNTNTAGTWSYWAACSSSPSCRTQADFTISTTATVHTVTPGTATCYNPSTPVTIGISTSTNGMPYQLNLDGTPVGSTVNGIPSSGAISFPSVTAIGTYTVTAVSGSCQIPMSGSVVIKPVPIANAGPDVTIPCNGSVGLTGTSNSATLFTENFGTNVNAEVTSSTSGWKIKYLYGTEPANRSEWWISYNGANPYVSNMNNTVNCIPAGGGSSGLIMLDHRIYQTIMPCDYAWDEGDQDEIAYKTTQIDARMYTSVNLSFDYQVGGTFSGSNVYDYLQVMYSLDNGATWVAVSAGNNAGSYTLYRQLNGTTNAFFSNTANTPVTGTANVTMPSAVAGQQFLLGFRWVNDGDLTGAYVGGPMVDNISVTGAADYSWSPTTGVTGAGTATPTITQAGTYTLTVTAGNGCSASDQVVVTATSSVTINAFSPATSSRCQGAGMVTYTTTANGSTGITYSLDGPSLAGGNTINASTGQVTYDAAWSGTTTITASAAGCNGPATTTHEVTVYPLPTPTYTAFINPTVCSGVAVYYSTQSGHTNYTWSVPGTAGIDYNITAGGISTTNTDVTIKWLTAGYKTVTVNYTTTNGCTGASPASHTIEVFLSPVPTFTTSPAANTCTGIPVTYTTQSGQGNYSWTIPGSSGTDYNITGGGTSTNSVTLEWLTAGSKTVNANYESADGCVGLDPATHTTTVNTPPNVTNPTPATQTVPCAGTPAAISVIASGGIGTYSYQWYSNTSASTTGGTGVGTNSSSFPPPSTVGTTYYYCEVTGVGSGCAPVKTTLTAEVIVVAAPSATVIVDECMSYATGDKYYVLVTGSGGTPPYSYPGAFYTTTISPFEGVFEINAGTSSTYTVTDNAGCSYTTGSVTAPVGKPTNIVLTPTTAGNVTVDCWDNNFNKWITFRDAVSNDAILAIHDNGANLGLVTVSTYKEASAPLIWANQTGWNCTWTQHTAMRRHFKITTTAYQPSNNAVDVMLFFTDQEYLDLKSDAWNNNIAYPNPGYACTELDDVYNFNQLYVTKYSGPNEDGNYLNNAATPTGLYRVFGDNTTPSMPLAKAPYTSSGTGFQGIYGGSQTHHYVQMTVTEFSEFWLHGSSHSEALPVEMIFLQADAINNAYIRLTWATAIEINNDGFEVERSVDGQNWTQVGFVDGHDNATTQNDYSFNDMDVTPNVIYYYRLKQVDNDGAFEYTDIVSARLTGEATFSVKDFVPNPTMDKTSLIITATKDQDITVTFYDVIGQKMMESSHQVTKGANRFEFDLGKLASGTYTALVSSSNEVYTKKVVLAK